MFELIISEYYDLEMNYSKRIHLEANMLKRNEYKKYIEKSLFEYYKISKSINLVKNRISNLHLYRLI